MPDSDADDTTPMVPIAPTEPSDFLERAAAAARSMARSARSWSVVAAPDGETASRWVVTGGAAAPFADEDRE